jgi:hypothetical protein
MGCVGGWKESDDRRGSAKFCFLIRSLEQSKENLAANSTFKVFQNMAANSTFKVFQNMAANSTFKVFQTQYSLD